MDYEKFREFIHKNWNIIIIIIIFLASVIGYGIGFYLSNFSQTSALNICKTDLLSSLKNISDYVTANKDLVGKNLDLLTNYTNLNIENQKLISSVVNQTSFIVALQLSNSALQAAILNNTAANTALSTLYYARQYCCSIGDISSGNVRNWSIVGNDIVCYGSSTVNCKI
jgi:hypothetical protein